MNDARNANPDKPIEATLYLPLGDQAGQGFLFVSTAGRQVAVELSPAKVSLLIILNEQLKADRQLPAMARGWRSAERIGRLLPYPLDEYTVRRYVCQINRALKDAAAEADPGLTLPRPVTTKRHTGLRLTWPLKVVTPEAGDDLNSG